MHGFVYCLRSDFHANYDICSGLEDNQIFNVFAVVKNIKKIYNSANLIVF
nr:MAG TPA: hypothetical protein [Caudoviricetes sp.]